MLNKKVRISVYAGGILGSFNEVTITGSLSYSAITNFHDVLSVYENIVGEIPEEFRVKMVDDEYLLFVDETGKQGFLGRSWIKPNGIQELGDAKTTVVINSSDINAILSALHYAGFDVESSNVE